MASCVNKTTIICIATWLGNIS